MIKNFLKRVFEVESLKRERLSKKVAIGFIFTTIVPLLLVMYLVYLVGGAVLETNMEHIRAVIFWMVAISLVGYWIIRSSIMSINALVRNGRAIASGDLSKRITVDTEDEVGELANSFNAITNELQDRIFQLEESKRLLYNIFKRIGTAFSSGRGIDTILELIVETVTSALNSNSSVIMLKEENSGELYTKVSYGLDKTFASNFRVKSGEGPIGTSFKEGRAIAEALEFKNNVAGLEYSSILSVPLIYKNEALGIIAIIDKKQGSFNEDDLILLSNVASQVAVAIDDARLNEDIEKTYVETITALAIAVEAKDPYSRGHLDRVAKYVTLIGDKLKLSPNTMKILRNGAVLHDLGKIGVKDEILKKGESLTPDEADEMQRHAIIGETILKPIHSLSPLCELIRHHHERYDGTGYPDRLKGEEIPVTAKIIAVADTFDAMTTDRPYQKAFSIGEAKEILKKESGTHFDPKVVDAFLEALA